MNKEDGKVARGPMPTAEQRKLGNVLDLIGRLDELRARGLSNDQMAERIRLSHPEVPGGGPWSAEAVERVLSIVDANREPTAPSVVMEDPAAAQRHVPTRRSNQANRSNRSNRSNETNSRPGTRRYHHRPGQRWPDDVDRNDSRRSFGLFAIVGALMAASLVLALLQGGYLSGLNPGGSEEPATSHGSLSSNELEIDDTAATEVEQSDAVAAPDDEPGPGDDSTKAGNPDAFTIRIEPSNVQPDSSIAPAQATIRNDGKLYVEGAFGTEAQAQNFLDQATAVFGEAAIVADYVIDSAAPNPQVSDIALEKPVLFKSGSTEIDPEYIPFLEACGDVLKLNPHITMSITGLTDATGDARINLELSQRRADAIVAFYRSIDVDNEQLVALGVGEDQPVADNDSPEGRAENRRAMLQLLNVISDT